MAFEFNKLKEDVTGKADEILKSVLESSKYSMGKTSEWIDKINSEMISHLRDISPNFKYIVSTVVLQKIGAGFHSEVTSYWDPSTDGVVLSKFENESLICLSTIICVAI